MNAKSTKEIAVKVAAFVPVGKSGKALGGAAKANAVKKFEAALVAEAAAAKAAAKAPKVAKVSTASEKGRAAALKAWAVRRANAVSAEKAPAKAPTKAAAKGATKGAAKGAVISKKAVAAASGSLIASLLPGLMA